MTDETRLVELLRAFNIIYTTDLDDHSDGETYQHYTISEGVGENVEGYVGFEVDFHFTEASEFVKMGIWE